MVTLAPNWSINPGWEHLNSTNLSLIDAGVDGLKYSGGYSPTGFLGFAYLLGVFIIFFVVGFLLWQRTQKMYVAVFGCIIVSVLLSQFGMLEQMYMVWIAGIGAAFIAVEWILHMMNKD